MKLKLNFGMQLYFVSESIRQYPAVLASTRQYPGVSGSIWQYHVEWWVGGGSQK